MSEPEQSVERELKFPCGDLDALRSRLIELEAERAAPSAFEENLVFDRQGELTKRESILRLRSDSHGARLTFKGPPSFEGDVKVRVEHETRLDDAAALHRILESLGYKVFRRYQKYREEWLVGGVTVCLDRTPIGDFAEFEGEKAERLAERFGFPATEAEPRNYLELYADYRQENPEAPEDMVFPE